MSGVDEANEKKNGLATKMQVINFLCQNLLQRKKDRQNSLNILLK